MDLVRSNTCDRLILLVEDDARFADVLSTLFVDHGWVLHRVEDVAQARAFLDYRRPEIIIVDLYLPDGEGLEIVQFAAGLDTPIPTLVITLYGTDDTVRQAMSHGASGYLLKDDPMVDYLRSVDACLSGNVPMSPAAVRAIVAPMQSHALDAMKCVAQLSRREREVMILLGEGYHYNEIADTLGLSLGTIQTYIKRLYMKLDVHSKADVARLAAQWKPYLNQ